MSGTAGTLLNFPPAADTLIAIEAIRSSEPLVTPPSNPLLDFFQAHLQSALDFYRLLLNPDSNTATDVVEVQPPPPIVHKIIHPIPSAVQSVAHIHSSSSSSVSFAAKLPQPLETSGGSSSTLITNYKPSESFGSSVAFHKTYGPPQVGRSGQLFASRNSLDADDIQTRLPVDALDATEDE